MRFEKIIPVAPLQPYVRHFVIAENDMATEYNVLPSTSMVVGFQYKGKLALVEQQTHHALSISGISGMADELKRFANTANVGSILVYFTETGLAHFTNGSAYELFNQSVSLDQLFDRTATREVEERLSFATSDQQRIGIVQKFLLAQLKSVRTDQLVIEAVRLIYAAKGSIRIGELHKKLLISQSPFEKRFRKLVGTTPKKFASVVRFNTVIDQFSSGRSLMEICYENNFFDPAHFSKDFKRFTGEAPEDFRKRS